MKERDLKNRIDFLVACISEFGKKFSLSNTQAFAYLRRFTGIDFLLDCYEAEHTLSIENVVSDLQLYCFNRGGLIK